ncbi:hypothetical protein L1049_009538 [Liquidambar formosana]|uniref:Hydroxyproline-rich glycoprotein family protein n=1 Tax=Liquidambar formosana TaxID=63359 RepID=A0AAP0R3J9_LIQFO
MATGTFCGVAPLLFRDKPYEFEAIRGSDVPKNQKNAEGLTIDDPREWAGNFNLIKLRQKILTCRDIIDLPPFDGSASINDLLIETMENLHKLYPEIIPEISMSEMKETSINQRLAYFCNALKSIGDSWMTDQESIAKFNSDIYVNVESSRLEHLVEVALEILDFIIEVGREKSDMMDEEDDQKTDYRPQEKTFGNTLMESYSDNKTSCSSSPVTPTSVLPELTNNSAIVGPFANMSYRAPLLLPLRVQAVGKLNPIDVKRLSFHMLPHMVAQDSSNLIQKNKIVEKPKPEIEVKNNFEVTVADTKEDTKNCEAMEETPKSQMSKSNEDKFGQNGYPTTPPVSTPVTLARGTTEELLPPESPPKLPRNLAAASPPPPSPPKLSSNVVVPATAAAAPLPPPPTPMFLPNIAAAAQPPPPPPQPPLPPNLLQNMAETGPPPPPPPPPKMSGNVTTTPPPQLPKMPLKGSVPSPPPPMPLTNGAVPPPPPPPFGAAKSLRPKKAATKLKRSTHMGNMYRLLKGKVEGSSLDGKSSLGRKSQIGGSAGGKQGMDNALAEITKRSAYFQQIEKDVQKYSNSIKELNTAINSFQRKDMAELLKFRKYVESHLENLTDETQVLARFEDFPTKKLETLRTAASLYSKLDAIVTDLVNWKIEAPLGQLLDKVERYFSKIKGEVDALERTKDEESKKFQTYNIYFDFHILIKIKELMVDVSSGCMELALKERREAKATTDAKMWSKNEGRTKGCAKMLWKAFQLAFRVYTFAGGQDDRADTLTRELAREIETDPHHQ